MRVYLSSTLIDLGPERLKVKEALGGECIVVESYSADERSVRESCLADVAGCDLFIAIVGLRYGIIPPGQPCSITQLEYREARERGLTTWVFVKDEDEIKPKFVDAYTDENPRELIESFRGMLTSGADGSTRSALFKTPEDLKAHVLMALLRFRQRRGEPKPEPRPFEGDPYPGLRAFRPTEADRFFGRDDEVAALLERLLAKDQRFLALIGASGSGKSSLVYAGLIPQLSTNPLGTKWFTATLLPGELGADPFVPLAAALKSCFPDLDVRTGDLAQRLRDCPADIAETAAQALCKAGPDARLLLFVDQLEEVFAHKVSAGARTAFFALMAAAVACPLLRVVIAMRADFYAQWPQDEASIALLHAGHFPVAVPGQVALAKMIEGPANVAGLQYSPPQLVQRLLDDTGTAAGALALAEFALAQLYKRRVGKTLTEAAYGAFGGVAGAIDGLAEHAVALAERALAQEGAMLDDEAWSRLFVAIASVEEQGTELAVVRRRAAASDLPGPVLTLVQHLVDARLLVSSGSSGSVGDQPAHYEVGHEAVFSHWKRFKGWCARYAEDLAARRQVERAAAEWHHAGCPSILRWGWERQKPALEALRKLSHMALPPPDSEYADLTLALWSTLKARLPEPPLRGFLYPEPMSLIDELNLAVTPHQRREEIGLRLNQIGDPRRGVGLDDGGLPDIAWINVPAGEVTLELALEPDTESQAKRRGKRKALPQSRFAVEPFQLARYPITWCQYRAFLNADDGYCNAAWWQGRPREDEPGQLLWAFANYPALYVSWYDAMAYCCWLSAKLGQGIRLPNECEWQWAAVASTAQKYPWPGDWDSAMANSDEGGILRTVGVGMYALGRSAFGLDDMAGNVWEWCSNNMAKPDSESSSGGEALRVVRGGAWNDDARSLRASYHSHINADFRHLSVGFRVCHVSTIEKPATGALPAGLPKRRPPVRREAAQTFQHSRATSAHPLPTNVDNRSCPPAQLAASSSFRRHSGLETVRSQKP